MRCRLHLCVVAINASDNCLTHLPIIIGNLRKLQILDVHKNSIQQLPETIANCDRLVQFITSLIR